MTDENGKVRKFKGQLIKGSNANVAIINYEIINGKEWNSKSVLFFTRCYGYVSVSSRMQGFRLHQIKIDKEI